MVYIAVGVLRHFVFISPRKLDVLEETAQEIFESTGNEVSIIVMESIY